MKTKQNERIRRIFSLSVLLLGALVSGCDGVLGIAGLVAGCVEGEERCHDNAREACNTHGTWERQEFCGAKTCIAAGGFFGCVDCAPESKRCLGNTPQNCTDVGQWEDGVSCGANEQCKAGACI